MFETFGKKIIQLRLYIVIVWLFMVFISLPFAPQAQKYLKPGGFSNENFPSVEARKLMQEKMEVSTIAFDLVFSHKDWSPFDPRFTESIQGALLPLNQYSEVSSIVTHLDDPNRASNMSNTVHATVGLSIELEESLDFLKMVEKEINPGALEMIITGGPALYRDISLASEKDLRKGELFAFPLATVTLLIVFGTIIAAFLPAAVGGGGVILGLALVYLISQSIDMSVFALNIVTLLGIGLGIDYSLFYTSRFKEELNYSKDVTQAIINTHKRAGPAIFFSACTSLVGLVSLITFDIMMLRSVGMGAVIVIFCALFASLTLMPVMLSFIGPRINYFRILPKRKSKFEFWLPFSKWVMSKPWLILLPTTTILIILATPVLNMRLGTVDATILPQSIESRQGFDILYEEFDFGKKTIIPVIYTFEGKTFLPENLEYAYNIGKNLENIEGVTRVKSIVNIDETFTFEQYLLMYENPNSLTDFEVRNIVENFARDGAILFLLESDFHPFGPETRNLVTEIRSYKLDKGEMLVDGGPGETTDIVNSLYKKFPIVVLVVVIVTYISLMILFRSIILPLKAVILNILSIFASYGALVFIFQDGNFSGLLNFQPMGVIDSTLPILLFAVIFGLSMDYEIFLLSRVSEAYKKTNNNVLSVSIGLQKSGSIITGAAAILIVVASSFIIADVVVVKAIGLGLAIAVFVDVTLVRALIAPSLMRIAGPLNWWLPSWLDKILPNISHEN